MLGKWLKAGHMGNDQLFPADGTPQGDIIFLLLFNLALMDWKTSKQRLPKVTKSTLCVTPMTLL